MTRGAHGGEIGSTPAILTGHRPWLDGVRALAVGMVLVQHAFAPIPIAPGFVGVGILFALSGYLITSLLLYERADRGSVSLPSFYLRRAARLLPALFLVVVVSDVVFAVQHDFEPIKGSVAALAYVSNYAQVVQPDFVPGFGPTWSLAVEEHFYLVWPLALLFVTRWFGLRAALHATLAVCVAALLWRAGLAALGADYLLLGIGSFERADALLYGCAAAIALQLGWRPKSWMLWVGIGALAALPIAFTEESYLALVLGDAALGIVSAGAVVSLDYVAPEWLRRLLSLRFVVTIGVLSYGIYLWHGPILRIAENAGYSGRAWGAVAILVTISAAALSYRFLEAPLRARARRRAARMRDAPVLVAPGGATAIAAEAPVPRP